MDAIARSTARSTATMREHNVARRRMGKPFTRKPFGTKRIGSAILQFSIGLLYWEGKPTAHLFIGTISKHVRSLPNVARYWAASFPIALNATDFARHLTYGNLHRHVRYYGVPSVTKEEGSFEAWLRYEMTGISRID